MATKNKAQNTVNVEAQLAALRAQREEDARKIADLEKKVRFARGTRDVGEQAAEASTSELPARLEAALRAHPCTLEDLTTITKEPAGRVSAAMRLLKKRLVNVGSSENPRWFWFVGDDGTTEEINTAVEALIKDRPMTFLELMTATGARQGRVSGAIVAMQRSGKVRIVNLGTPVKARWFIVPEDVQLSRLKKR